MYPVWGIQCSRVNKVWPRIPPDILMKQGADGAVKYCAEWKREVITQVAEEGMPLICVVGQPAQFICPAKEWWEIIKCEQRNPSSPERAQAWTFTVTDVSWSWGLPFIWGFIRSADRSDHTEAVIFSLWTFWSWFSAVVFFQMILWFYCILVRSVWGTGIICTHCYFWVYVIN